MIAGYVLFGDGVSIFIHTISHSPNAFMEWQYKYYPWWEML